MQDIIHFNSIAEIHQALGLGAPKHPLISIHNDGDIEFPSEMEGMKFSMGMYFIAFKSGISGALGYGRNSYDFQDGTMVFMAPNQVVTVPGNTLDQSCTENEGWTITFHPDLIRKSHLGTIINDYNFFSYESNEALHLSEEEAGFIAKVVQQIKEEYHRSIDQHSQRLIISNLELLLNYCLRFYDRQFYTRTNLNKDFAAEFETVLMNYLNSEQLAEKGVPQVAYFGEQLNMSANYLSDLLKKETGKSAKAQINEAVIEKAKTILLNSTEPINQVAYQLGFDYPQSFTRLFKAQTGFSPLEYRAVS
jgi:AraC-like DNA-binding protein